MISHLHPPEQQIPRRLGPESSEMHIGTSPAEAIHRCKRGGGRQGEEAEARSNPSLPRGQFCSMVNHQHGLPENQKRPHYGQAIAIYVSSASCIYLCSRLHHLPYKSSIPKA